MDGTPQPYILTAASKRGTVLFDWDVITVRVGDELESFPIETVSDVNVEAPLLIGRGLFHFRAEGRRITVEYARRDAAQFGVMAATPHHVLFA